MIEMFVSLSISTTSTSVRSFSTCSTHSEVPHRGATVHERIIEIGWHRNQADVLWAKVRKWRSECLDAEDERAILEDRWWVDRRADRTEIKRLEARVATLHRELIDVERRLHFWRARALGN